MGMISVESRQNLPTPPLRTAGAAGQLKSPVVMYLTGTCGQFVPSSGIAEFRRRRWQFLRIPLLISPRPRLCRFGKNHCMNLPVLPINKRQSIAQADPAFDGGEPLGLAAISAGKRR